MEYWCHGAPGIALSRLRAFQLIKDEELRSDALAGLKTTSRMIESALAKSSVNFSLCHGLLGNAEVIAYGRDILGADEVENDLVAAVAAVGIERFSEGNLPWPCGTHSGETSNLMLGLSGIGYAYLRFYDRNVPSLLLLLKEQWRVNGP